MPKGERNRVIFLKKKSGRLKKKEVKKKIEMLKCRITGIEAEYLVMLPIGANSGVDGSVTWSLKNFPSEKHIFKIGDKVIALNINKLSDSWQAKSILVEK